MLAEHIKQSGETQAVWADRIGISRPYLNSLIKGVKTPSLPVALRIERLTGGVVKAASWVAPDPAEAPADAPATPPEKGTDHEAA